VSRAAATACILATTAALLGAGTRDGGDASADSSLQVTVFGIVAKPDDSAIDPKLANIATALRKFRPDHGFALRGVKGKRIAPGESVRCDLGDELVAEAQLVRGLDGDGKVRIKFTLSRAGRAEFTTTVTTPPNQLFFCEKPLSGGTDRLLIGVGAR
jgi:hypothetical protein